MLRNSVWTVFVLAAGVLVGCGGGGGDGGSGTDTANDAVSDYAGPIASSDTARGEEVYNAICMACHSNGPALADIGWDPAQMRQQIREGSGGMPPMPESRVSADDLEAVLAYMTTNGGVTGSVDGGSVDGGSVDGGSVDGGGGEEPASAGGEEPASGGGEEPASGGGEEPAGAGGEEPMDDGGGA